MRPNPLSGKAECAPVRDEAHRRESGKNVEAAGIEPSATQAVDADGIGGSAPPGFREHQTETQDGTISWPCASVRLRALVALSWFGHGCALLGIAMQLVAVVALLMGWRP